MKKSVKIIFTILVIALLAFAYYYYSSKRINTNDEKEKTEQIDNVSVRMKWFFAGTMSGWFAGVDNNFFKDENINLTINPGGPDNSSIKLVAAGTDLFGVAGADEVLIARNKGIPVVAIGVLFKNSPIGFISKKEKNINSPKDWENKTIEVDYGSNAEIQYRALIKKFNVKNIKEVPYTYSLVPFIENKVDVSVAYIMDQVVTLRKKGINLNVITSKQYGINPYGDVIITTEKTLKEKPELVKRFLKAVKKSQIWAINNPDKAVKALINHSNNLKFENEIDVWKETIPFIIPDNNVSKILVMDENRWVETRNILVQFDVIPASFNIDNSYSIINNN